MADVTRRAYALVALVTIACNGARPPPTTPRSTSPDARAVATVPGFLKGQLHAHTSKSGDSDTPAADAAVWYAQHGFDFVVFTDHNHLTEIDPPPGILVFRGVELTQNLRTCVPPPRPKEACLLHVNALFIAPWATWKRLDTPPGLARVDIYGQAVDRALALGGLAQLNHPNFQGGADLDVLLAVVKRGATLVEIANQAVDSTNEGDAERLSTDALWDAALVRGAHVFGTATDDAHHYDDAPDVQARGEVAYTGDRGFVMVRAARNEAAIRAAISAGDFYASTGVIFDRLQNGPDGITVEPCQDRLPRFTFEVISAGHVVERSVGTSIHVDPRKFAPGYVRVRVSDGGGHQAWTQPVWL